MERSARLPTSDGLCPVCAYGMMELKFTRLPDDPPGEPYYQCGVCGHQHQVYNTPGAASATME